MVVNPLRSYSVESTHRPRFPIIFSIFTQLESNLPFNFSLYHHPSSAHLYSYFCGFPSKSTQLIPTSFLHLLNLGFGSASSQSIMSFRFRGGKNASSGMGVADHCKGTFLELQRKKAHRYVIFKIDEKKNEVVVEKTGNPAESYDDFTSALPENDCRYAVFDFDFVTSENCQKSKIFFIAWSPATSRIRAKMLYATSKDRLRHELDGVHYEIQATDPTEMELEVLRERVY